MSAPSEHFLYMGKGALIRGRRSLNILHQKGGAHSRGALSSKYGNPYINPSKFEPLKPSRSGDISLLVFKISKAVEQPCLDKKIQCLFSKYTYFLYILT